MIEGPNKFDSAFVAPTLDETDTCDYVQLIHFSQTIIGVGVSASVPYPVSVSMSVLRRTQMVNEF